MGDAVLKRIRNCTLGAIILVGAAIVVGGMTDSVPTVTWEPLVDFFRYGSLLLFDSAAWAARALADIRLTLFGTPVLLLLFYFLTRPQPQNH
jgi:multisubunit Na+/H+ antiporter MnhB subunit